MVTGMQSEELFESLECVYAQNKIHAGDNLTSCCVAHEKSLRRFVALVAFLVYATNNVVLYANHAQRQLLQGQIHQ